MPLTLSFLSGLIKKKRQVNPIFDFKPSIVHRFHFDLTKKVLSGEKALDIGCWTGQYAGLVSEICDVTGVDINAEAIGFAKKRHPKIKFFLGSVLSMPFEDNSFDIVTFWDVLEHLSKGSEKRALVEIHRVLKKGGILFLTTPNNHPLSVLFDLAHFLRGHRHYSYKFIASLLSAVGFSIRSWFCAGGMASLFFENYQLFFKHLLKRPPIKIFWLENKVKEEFYQKKGFKILFIQAEKR